MSSFENATHGKSVMACIAIISIKVGLLQRPNWGATDHASPKQFVPILSSELFPSPFKLCLDSTHPHV